METQDRGLELGRGGEKWQEYPGETWDYQDLVAINGIAPTVDFQVYDATDDVRVVTATK